MGIPGTSYVVSDNIGDVGMLSVANIQEMYAAGWDIGNHTKDHAYFNTLTEAQIETELADCAAALDGWGLTRASHHVAYPGGIRNADSDAAMLATGMLTGRMASGQWFDSIPAQNVLQINASFPNTTALMLQTIQYQIASMKNSGGLLLVCFHDLTGAKLTEFQAFIDWLVLENIQCLTISQAYTAMGY